MLTNSATTADPLSSYAAPTTSGLTTQPSLPGYGTYAMSPGIYNGGVSIGGGMTVTMAPGTYYMKGGGFSVANGATLTGSGVMIYLDSGGGQLSFQGGGNITLSAPTTGTYSGVLVFQDRANTSTISIANGSTSNMTGTIYAPSAPVTFAGGAANSEFGSQFIVKSMNISNNASISVNTTTTNVARGPGPQPGGVIHRLRCPVSVASNFDDAIDRCENPSYFFNGDYRSRGPEGQRRFAKARSPGGRRSEVDPQLIQETEPCTNSRSVWSSVRRARRWSSTP